MRYGVGMATIFSRIIAGELPGHLVWRDDECVAFLSINPLRTGHALVVPRREVDHWLDLEPPLLGHCMSVARTVGSAQMAAFRPTRIGMMIAGLEVPHCHVHVVPIDTVHDLDFGNARHGVAAEELRDAAARLRGALRELGHGAQAAD